MLITNAVILATFKSVRDDVGPKTFATNGRHNNKIAPTAATSGG